MRTMTSLLCCLFLLSALTSSSCDRVESRAMLGDTTKFVQNMIPKDSLPKTDSAWKEILSPEEYRVLREKGTERPHTGQYDEHWDSGIYVCKACGIELFRSNAKFDAHCGWPSFYESVDKSKVVEKVDLSHGMVRTEVLCGNCGGHLGHVFNDGPNPTGLRYCINSVSLGFKEKD